MSWRGLIESAIICGIVSFIVKTWWLGVLAGALWLLLDYVERIHAKNFP